MNTEQYKRIAYDLTLEYIKQNSTLTGNKEEISQMVNLFAEIYEKFYKELFDSKKLF